MPRKPPPALARPSEAIARRACPGRGRPRGGRAGSRRPGAHDLPRGAPAGSRRSTRRPGDSRGEEHRDAGDGDRRGRGREGPGMNRRAFLTTLSGGLLAAPLAAQAQPAAKVYRIGFLGNSTPALEANLVGPFREGLRDLNYVEGRNIVIEYRWAEGQYERFPVLIAELLARKVDVIVTAGTPATQAVKRATTSVPLVMVAIGDPVTTGIVASLRRPGGNITGLTSISEDLEGKRLELLREVVPTVSRVAVLWNPDNQSLLAELKEIRTAAQV